MIFSYQQEERLIMPRSPIERKDPASEPSFQWLQLPSIYCDTYSLDTFGEAYVVRMVFGDYVSREYHPFYRASITMPLEEAKGFLRSLSRVIKNAEENLAKAEADSKPEDGA
jgi:uncharacterized NAD(P)/FAD-binding protein YdhS